MNKTDALDRLKDLRECFRRYETIEVAIGDLTALNVAIAVMEKQFLNSMDQETALNQDNAHVVTVKLDADEFTRGLNDLRLAIEKLKSTTINFQIDSNSISNVHACKMQKIIKKALREEFIKEIK